MTECLIGLILYDYEMLMPCLSCRPKDRSKAKYDLMKTVRTHTGSEDDSFGCMGVTEDKDGILGVFLKRNVVAVAGRAMAKNIRALGPMVLPYLEMVSNQYDVYISMNLNLSLVT